MVANSFSELLARKRILKSAFFLFSQFTFVLLIRLDLKIQLINHRTLIKSREKKSQDRWKLGDYA